MKQTVCPLLSPQTDFLDIVEWIGATALNMNWFLNVFFFFCFMLEFTKVFYFSSQQQNYTSSLCCPEPNCVLENVNILRWQGFFTSREAELLLNVMLKLNQELLELNNSPWLNLTFHGFDRFQTGFN